MLDDSRRPWSVALAASAILSVIFVGIAIYAWSASPVAIDVAKVCLAPQKWQPLLGTFDSPESFLDEKYINASAQLLSGAVQIKTESYDDMREPNSDKRFDVFFDFHKYVRKAFPLAYSRGQLVYINTHGLLYRFEGTSNKKPIALLSHQDVVPVDKSSLDQWEHEPFSGHFDGTYLYGRGATDTKNSMIGILEAVESLLAQNWQPDRDVVLAFGYDEEIGGQRGAKHLAEHLEGIYGKDSFEFVLDEGPGILELGDALVAGPAVTEKGYMDVSIKVHTPGGHSSKPPDNTGVGIAAAIVNELEKETYASSLTDGNPTLEVLKCQAKYDSSMDPAVKQLVFNHKTAKERFRLVEWIDASPLRYLFRTSRAVDIISGGVKINALPELVEILVNHRVAVDMTIKQAYNNVVKGLESVAKEYGLGLESSGNTIQKETGNGNIEVTPIRTLEPAPISRSTGNVWKSLGGVTRYIYEDLAPQLSLSNRTTTSAPTLLAGNTDTRWYWNLTQSIYRYEPILETDRINAHTVNEKLLFRAHVLGVAWYYSLLLEWTTPS